MKIIIATIVLTTTATFSWYTFGSTDTKKIGQAVQASIEEAAGEGIEAGEEQIKRLNASQQGLRKIDSISDLTGVEDLNLSGNQIEDLAALGKLKNLVVLDLSNNRITDLRPLSGLTALQYLNVGHNQLQSLDPLLALPELTGLVLTGNNDLELGVLKTMSNLQFLFLTPGPNLSQEDFDVIQKVLPNCTVTLVSSVD